MTYTVKVPVFFFCFSFSCKILSLYSYILVPSLRVYGGLGGTNLSVQQLKIEIEFFKSQSKRGEKQKERERKKDKKEREKRKRKKELDVQQIKIKTIL